MKTKEFRMKKLVIISALILTIIMGIAFIAGVTAVTDTTSVDPASLSLSLFKKKPSPTTTITGNAIDESGNTIATVTVKAGEEVGRVRDDFYGVNTHGYYLGAETKIDMDNNGISESPSNLEWHRKAFLDSGMKYMRWDAGLQNYYFYNETNLNYYFKGNLDNKIDQLKWAHENGIRILLIINYMPPWLADTTINGCNLTKLTDCPPYNYEIWKNITSDYLNKLTENGKYSQDIDIEIWNEPYANFWMGSLTYDHIDKANKYIELYNVTYNSIKRDYPNIKIGGPSGFRSANNLMEIFILNEGNNTNFLSIHPYDSNRENNLRQYNDVKRLLINCSYYNINCSRIILSEWNVGDILLKNESSLKDKYSNSLSYSYLSILNSYPEQISMILYQWSETKKYSSNTNYPEYPKKWSMVSEAGLDNPYPTYYPSYNVTKDFAHYHAGGNMIVNSSSNNNSIKSVASLNPQGIWHITVINTAINNININIDVSSTGVKAIKDLATDTVYPVVDGIANVGILTEYAVKHYQGIADYDSPSTESNEEKSSSGGSSSNTNIKVISVNEIGNLSNHEIVSLKSDTNVVVPTNEILYNLEGDSSKSSEEDTIYGPTKSEDNLSTEEYENELQGNSYTGALSLAISNKSYLTIAIILLGSIICTAIIISILYRKKKREADKVKKLMDWVDKARALGYTSEKMKEMLAQYNWDKELVEKIIGMQ